MDEETITWETFEFEYHKKNADWYWILGIVSIAGALISVMLNNILFAILIIVGSLTVALYASKPPKKVTFSISRRGIQVDNVLHPFSSLDSFWIDTVREHAPKLLLTSKRTFSMQMVIPLGDISRDDVREYLLQHVREIEQGESIIERAMELVRF